jgi:hypothetical protein
MYPQPASFTWSAGGAAASFPPPATGDGSNPTPPAGIAITSSGLYTAPPVGDATGTVTAMADGISGSANVAVEDDVEVYVQANSGTAPDPETLDETKIFTDTGALAGTISTLNPPGVTLCGAAADINLGDGTHLDASGASVVRKNAGGTVIQTYITITNSSYLPWSGMVLDPSGTSFWACDASCYVYEFSIATGAEERGFLASGDLGEIGILQVPTLLGLTVDDHNNTTNTVTAIDATVPVLYVPEDLTSHTADVDINAIFSPNTIAAGNDVSLTVTQGSQIVEDTGCAGGGTLEQVLSVPVKSTASVFVVKATLDTAAGTDTLEVDVDVVTPWTDVVTWTAGQSALVMATADGASLQDLAKAVTGNPDNAKYLGNVGTVTRGTAVDVTPLLNILDDALRGNVLAVAKPDAPKSLGFGKAGDAAALAYNASQIAAVFVAGTPTTEVDCMVMVELEMAYAVIGVLQPGDFDAMGLTPLTLKNDYWTDLSGTPLADLKAGDYVKFWNDAYYRSLDPNGMWESENAIMTGPDSYYGWAQPPGDTDTEAGWKATLSTEYNKVAPFLSKYWFGQVPGYTSDPGSAGFLNVAKLAQKIFDYTTGQE